VAKHAGVIALPMHVSTCIELVFFDSRTAPYEPRGWTRVERVFAYAFCFSPLVVYIGEGYPRTATDLKALCDANPGIYSMDGAGNVFMVIMDPLAEDAMLTNPADREIVRELCEVALSVPPLNMSFAQAIEKSGKQDFQVPLKLGVDQVCVDTLHEKMDVQSSRGVER